MPEMFSYIFSSLNSSHKAIQCIGKALKQQSQINRSFVIFSLATTYTILVQNKQIEKLSNEIKELKKVDEGENG